MTIACNNMGRRSSQICHIYRNTDPSAEVTETEIALYESGIYFDSTADKIYIGDPTCSFVGALREFKLITDCASFLVG